MIKIEKSYDPTGAYETTNPDRLVEACGLIPYFFMDGALQTPTTAEEMMEHMLEAYGFRGFTGSAFDACTVTEEGVFQSPPMDDDTPPDPDLSPYLCLSLSAGINDTPDYSPLISCFIYPYGIVAVRDSFGDVKITRMD